MFMPHSEYSEQAFNETGEMGAKDSADNGLHISGKKLENK